MRPAPYLVLLLATAAAAEPVLHEPIRPPRAPGRIVGGPTEEQKKTRIDEERRENPPAIRQDEKILVEPPSAEAPRPAEVVHGDRGFAADRDTEARPDYLTQADGTLHYSEVFNPSVVPFKRMSALDAVGPSYTLGVADAKLSPLPVGGDTSTDRDLFWASLVVNLPPGGRPVAIPSMAPDMRILSYETDSRVRLVFVKDSADNFALHAADPKVSGQHRVVFLADAAATYFAPRPLSGPQPREKRAPATLPPRVRQAAAVVLVRAGVNRADDTATTLSKLVEYFRSFEAGEPPSPSGDIYLDLALSRRGVCRHRAFAFMITANAAGLPARYVTNEAHAFAEVWLDGAGWARIDLGGAALELEVTNAGEKSMHRPRAPDPFPKPREYAENYTRLRGDIDGLSDEQIAEARRPPAGRRATADDPGSTSPVEPGLTDLPRPGEASPKKRLALVVDEVDRRAFRGEAVRITGHADGGPAGLRIDLYLAPAGARGRGARVIGQTVTDPAGKFALAVELPADLGLGTHEVFAVTPGNAEYGAAISE